MNFTIFTSALLGFKRIYHIARLDNKFSIKMLHLSLVLIDNCRFLIATRKGQNSCKCETVIRAKNCETIWLNIMY